MYCKHLIRVLLFILPFFVAGGCTKEDTSDCRTAVRLQLSYTHNQDNAEKFDDLVSCGELFLYDGAGALLERRMLSAGEIETGEVSFSVGQEAGKYSAVVWLNASCCDDYVLSGEDTMSTMRLEVLHDNGHVGDSYPNWQPLGELMHGISEFATDGLRTTVDAEISLRKLTNHIHIILDGAAKSTYAVGNPTSYSIQLSGSNGAYDCHADKLACQRLDYGVNYWNNLPDLGVDALIGEFHTLHLVPGDDMRLMVFNGTSTLYDESLTELLQNVYDKGGSDINPYGDTFSEWLWRFDEYALRFDSNMALTAVKILDWISIESAGGI